MILSQMRKLESSVSFRRRTSIEFRNKKSLPKQPWHSTAVDYRMVGLKNIINNLYECNPLND